MVVSCRSSVPVEQLAAQSKTTLWYQLYPHAEMLNQARDAVKAGCKAVLLTLGVASEGGVDWSAVDHLRQSVGVPLLLKGIMSPAEAKAAVRHGVQGIVVSNYAAHESSGMAAPIEVLPAIADAVAGAVPILVDGGFRRGSDVLKALALGARAVLIARPPVWALAAYGAEGVQRLLELLQTELARDMAMCGKPNLRSIDSSMLRIHRR